jgi:hypothetical protein
MIRIERSMFRLERNNAALLSLLQQLVDASGQNSEGSHLGLMRHGPLIWVR